MDQAMADLGTRVLNAARLAVAMHMNQASSTNAVGRQVMIGGAGPRYVTDDKPTAPVESAARDSSRAA
jgi:hypothetical protein